jgi:hypothetical protein
MPLRGATIRGPIEIAELELGNGFTVLSSPEPGLTGESEGVVDRTGPGRFSNASKRQAGKFGPKWQPGNGRLLRTKRRAAARCRFQPERKRATFKALIRRPQKGWWGAEKLSPPVRLQSSEPCMPASG